MFVWWIYVYMCPISYSPFPHNRKLLLFGFECCLADNFSGGVKYFGGQGGVGGGWGPLDFGGSWRIGEGEVLADLAVFRFEFDGDAMDREVGAGIGFR